MIQIRKEENQKKQKEKKLKVYKVNTHKKTVIALWVLLAMSFLFAVYKNFTAIDIHTVHETKVIEEQILDTHKIENFVENFAEVYYSWEQSAASIDNRTNALKGYLTGELQALNVDTVRKDIPVSSALTDFQIWEITEEKEQHYQVTYTVEQRITEGEYNQSGSCRKNERIRKYASDWNEQSPTYKNDNRRSRNLRNKRSDLGLYHWTSYALGYLCKSYNKYLGNSMECSVYSPYTHNRYCTVDFSFGS